LTNASSSVPQRLREAGLRPTVARVGVLQVIETAAPARICTEDMFRQMLLRGSRVNIGTVYRVAQELHNAGMLLREWGGNGKIHYRLKHSNANTQSVRLICRRSGRSVVLADADLYASLLKAASREGLHLEGQDLAIQVDDLFARHDPATQAGTSSTGRRHPKRTKMQRL